jgi:hypothetical protein
MRYAIAALAVLLGGCEEKPCARYAAHTAEVMTRGLDGTDLESRRATVKAAAQTACENGRVKPEVIACVLGASEPSELAACELGTSPETAEPIPPATDTPIASAQPATSGTWPRAEDVLPSGEVSKGSLVVAGEGYRFQVPSGFEPAKHTASPVAARGVVKGFVRDAPLTIYATVEPFSGDLDALAERTRKAAEQAGDEVKKDQTGLMSVAGKTATGRRLLVKNAERYLFRVMAVHEGKAYTMHIETPNAENAWANVGADITIRGLTFHVAPPAR